MHTKLLIFATLAILFVCSFGQNAGSGSSAIKACVNNYAVCSMVPALLGQSNSTGAGAGSNSTGAGAGSNSTGAGAGSNSTGAGAGSNSTSGSCQPPQLTDEFFGRIRLFCLGDCSINNCTAGVAVETNVTGLPEGNYTLEIHQFGDLSLVQNAGPLLSSQSPFGFPSCLLDESSGNMTSGNMTSGNMTSGNMTSGNMTSGNMSSGNMMGGNMTSGQLNETLNYWNFTVSANMTSPLLRLADARFWGPRGVIGRSIVLRYSCESGGSNNATSGATGSQSPSNMTSGSNNATSATSGSAQNPLLAHCVVGFAASSGQSGSSMNVD